LRAVRKKSEADHLFVNDSLFLPENYFEIMKIVSPNFSGEETDKKRYYFY